jgi:hypothetical protein
VSVLIVELVVAGTAGVLLVVSSSEELPQPVIMVTAIIADTILLYFITLF